MPRSQPAIPDIEENSVLIFSEYKYMAETFIKWFLDIRNRGVGSMFEVILPIFTVLQLAGPSREDGGGVNLRI